MHSLAHAFLVSAEKHYSAPALWCRGDLLTYGELRDSATSIAGSLISNDMVKVGDRVAILSDRTPTAYIGILAALIAGATYVPLNPRFPIHRNRAILERSGSSTLICNERHRGQLPELLEGLSSPPYLVLPESNNRSEIDVRQLLQSDLTHTYSELNWPQSDKRDLAYLLFTSGTTGIPKGVPIRNDSVLQYLKSVTELSGVSSDDRIIQLVDLTFDLSVHDMFLAWLNGASLYSVSENGSLLAKRFVDEHEITGWLSVPSTASFIKQAGELEPESMPSIKFTFFCGEALPVTVANSWANAAANSSIFNIYGPTEATIAFSAYKFEKNKSVLNDIVPLGHPLPNQSMGLFTTAGERSHDELAEICLSGNQVTDGYWEAPEITSAKFFEAEGKRWYRTGDLGRYDPGIGYHYAGRVDRQVKIRGFRVELQEIESAVRRSSGSELVGVIAWPITPDGIATSSVAFVVKPTNHIKGIIDECAKLLPDYMVPQRIIVVEMLPLNSNGKTDYAQLIKHPDLVSIA